jgi:putative ATPase
VSSEPSLFDDGARQAEESVAPLAVRMRPRTLDEVVGQRHLLAPGSPLRRLVEGSGGSSLILWGPPGTGKTTLATLVAHATGRRFRELSAVTAGVKDVRAVIDDARNALGLTGAQTVLFVDEVHRFSKTQQDALLPAVENRWVTLVAATTENPYFSVVSPLLSRSLLLTLELLTDEDVSALIDRALADERGLRGALTLPDDSRSHLLRIAGGDARRALTALEAGAGAAQAAGATEIDLPTLEMAVDRAAVRYDRDGDQHYDVVSAFIKSIRGSDVDAALHYLARMLTAGEDPRFVARRLMISASEDIGLADPTSLTAAVAAAQTLEMVGLPEARLALTQATIHLALAPKSNAVILAIDAASADVAAGLVGTVPPHLRDAHYAGARRLEHGRGYRYAHDYPGHVVAQQYAPDAVADKNYYTPTDRGAEAPLGERVSRLRALLRGATPSSSESSAGSPSGSRPESAEPSGGSNGGSNG